MENTKYTFILSMDGIQIGKIDTDLELTNAKFLKLKETFADFLSVPSGNLRGSLYVDNLISVHL